MDGQINFASLELNDTRHLSLTLLKKIKREKLQDLYFAISEQEREQKYGSKNHSYSRNKTNVFWEWQGDDGSWQAFEREEQQRLEHAIETNQTTVPFVNSLHFMHTVDLVRMELVNMQTAMGKKIRRIPPAPQVLENKKDRGGFKRGNHLLCSRDTCGSEGYTSRAFSREKEWYDQLEEFEDDGLDVLGSGSLHRTFGTAKSAALPNIPKTPRERRSLQCSTSAVNKWSRYSLLNKTSPKHVTKKSTNARKPSQKKPCKNEEFQKLREFLGKLKLHEHVDRFIKERITIKEVLLLTDQDMKSLGLLMGARKKLLEGIKNLKTTKEPPNELLCPITMAMMKDPVILCDGFSYEKSAIERWLADHDKSPMTNEKLDNKALTPNRQLKKLIEDYKAGQLDI